MLGIRHFKNKAIDFWQGHANLFHSDVYFANELDATLPDPSSNSIISLEVQEAEQKDLSLDTLLASWCEKGFEQLKSHECRHLSIIDPNIKLEPQQRAQIILRQVRKAILNNDMIAERITIIVNVDEAYSAFMQEVENIFPEQPNP